MRNVREIPITIDEIVECLTQLANKFAASDPSGDMKARLLREAITIVKEHDSIPTEK